MCAPALVSHYQQGAHTVDSKYARPPHAYYSMWGRHLHGGIPHATYTLSRSTHARPGPTDPWRSSLSFHSRRVAAAHSFRPAGRRGGHSTFTCPIRYPQRYIPAGVYPIALLPGRNCQRVHRSRPLACAMVQPQAHVFLFETLDVPPPGSPRPYARELARELAREPRSSYTPTRRLLGPLPSDACVSAVERSLTVEDRSIHRKQRRHRGSSRF